MIIAKEKREISVGEYILYMWQVEDLIRALQFDRAAIEEKLVNQYQVNDQLRKEIKDWYENLTLMLEKEQKIRSGHLQFLVNLADDLNRFHQALIVQKINPEYNLLFENIRTDLELIRNKTNPQHHDIEIALNTLYIILMLKMKNQDITEGTQLAVWKFGNFIGHLSNLFKEYEAGEIEIEF